jgi:hypothetical protein
MDGSDQTSNFAKCKIKPLTYVSPTGRISDLDDHTTRVLPKIHGCNPFAVSGLKRSQTLGLYTSEVSMALDSCHVSQQMDGSKLFRGFHCGFTRSLVHGIFNIPNSDASISRHLSGPSLVLRGFNPYATSVRSDG